MKQVENKGKIRKILWNVLPKWEKGSNKGRINWKECIGYKVKFIYDNIEGEIEIINYNKNYLDIKYLDKYILNIYSGDFKACKIGRLLGKYTGEFKREIGDVIQDLKRNLIIINKEYRKEIDQDKKYYKYFCNKCGYEGWIEESNLLHHKKGCSACCNPPKTVIESINSIVAKPETMWMIKYFKGGYNEAKLYTPQSNQKIHPICPDCGKIKNKAIAISNIYKKHSIGCSCSDNFSYPFKLMYDILEQLNIKFKTEYNPDWIKPKRYDFYFELNNKKYIIEMDGGLGHGKSVYSKSKKNIEETQFIDNYKDKLAKEHNIEVVRINCDKSELEWIKNNIINSRLSELFDLSKINWLKCEEFALSNLCKKVCEFKRDNLTMTCINISKIMNLSNITVWRYLKLGAKIWDWCKYDPKEELSRNAYSMSQKNNKPVEIFKNGVSLGIFPSATYLEDNGEDLFGVKFCQALISKVCLGQRKHHKKYIFKYV